MYIAMICCIVVGLVNKSSVVFWQGIGKLADIKDLDFKEPLELNLSSNKNIFIKENPKKLCLIQCRKLSVSISFPPLRYLALGERKKKNLFRFKTTCVSYLVMHIRPMTLR